MPAPGAADLQHSRFTLIKRRHFVPLEGNRSCTLDIFKVDTGLATGTAARVRYFDEAAAGEVPEGWRKPVTLRLPQDDDAYMNKFIERFAEQKLSAGYRLCQIKNRDREVRCRVAEDPSDNHEPSAAPATPIAAITPAAPPPMMEGPYAAITPASAAQHTRHRQEALQDRQRKAEVGPATVDDDGLDDPNRTVKKDIPMETVAQYFHLPIHQAADALKVGETWLKQKCREYSIKRWPYRKVKSIEKSLEKIFASVQSTKDKVQQDEMHKSLEELLRHRSNICLGQPRACYHGEVDKPVLPATVPQLGSHPDEKQQSRSPSPTSTLAKRPSPECDRDRLFLDSAQTSAPCETHPAKRQAMDPYHTFNADPTTQQLLADTDTMNVADLFSYEDALDLMY